MPRIPNWSRESRIPTLRYRNTETRARAVLHRAPDSYRYKWRAAILVEGYPVWSRGFETKEATMFREVLRERSSPELGCPECSNDDVIVGQKSADGAKVKRWFDCPDCGYEAPSRIVYGAERWRSKLFKFLQRQRPTSCTAVVFRPGRAAGATSKAPAGE